MNIRWALIHRSRPEGEHPDLEISERAGAGKRVMIVINHGGEARPLALPNGATPAGGNWKDCHVAPHGVALFRLR